MPIVKREKFEALAKFDNNPCISIYIPTHRAGKDVLEEKDRIQLKSQWKKVFEKLKEMNLSTDKIEKLGKPVEQLLTDNNFWRHQSDGLAIFIADGFFEKFTVPVLFEPFVAVSDHFYLKPLIPLFNGDGKFYLLALQMDRVQLFQGSRYEIAELNIEELVPSQLEERVGFEYEQTGRMKEVQNTRTGSATSHGFSAPESDRKNEFLRFFRAVDKGLHQILNNEKAPLVVACQDYLFSIYKEANTYKNLYPESLPGNPQDYPNMLAFHAATVQLLEAHFEKEKETKMKQFLELNPERTSTAVSEIIPAIYEGKVDTLFLQNREDIWGNYDENMASVEVNENENSENISLMNLAAVKVMEQGGNVYLIEDEFMPEKSSKMNAVFRY
ncbi:MAG TPA: hypothetical protein VFM59_02635 [Salinimicrobium sp.]|nr:hypothetical protein [Salinimicrobium sp.]